MTVASLVHELETQDANNDLIVEYSGSVTNSDGTSVTPGSTSSMPWVVNGDIYMRSSMMFVHASQRMVRRGAPVVIVGEVGRVTKPTKVSVFARRVHGGKRRLVATVPVSLVHGMGSFVYRASHVRSSTRFTFIWDGDDAYLGSTASTLVRVRAHK
jgi:hypothetical protein